jgi:hypothetical protein
MAAAAAIINLVSVDFGENALADRIHFGCACWGWVGEGSFQFSVLSDFQYGRHGSHRMVSVDFGENALANRNHFN